ncbi:MAG: LOG family protein [Xanthomonadales bacterium]|nr:LOG family protein [Xanthomonadales bacterium]
MALLPTVDATIVPRGGLDMLSRQEVARLRDASRTGLHELLRRCALAVMTSGGVGDDARALLECYHDFDIEVLQRDRGVQLRLSNAPASAFVDGRIVRGVAELLSAVVRDIVHVAMDIQANPQFDLQSSAGLTNAVFELLRNAGVMRTGVEPNLVVCWGGHSISRQEYDYDKAVGYHLGLRGLDICTGCGAGAMKAPMKGAAVGHQKQRIGKARYIGITEPGIIAAESPNPMVNNLVIMPDIEKRLEAFVRLGHGIIVFPGGVGTAEEILYLLGILLHPDNEGLPYPLVFAGPAHSAAYFEQIDRFLRLALGDAVAQRYQIIIDDPDRTARVIEQGIRKVRDFRIAKQDAFFFNWRLAIPEDFQHPFVPTHEAMAGLRLHRDREKHLLAADLRRAFSGIVAGNVKVEGIQAIERHGKFEITGDAELMAAMDAMLADFVAQHRMKLPGGKAYEPTYRLVW